jgi:hypothetical protein
MKTIRKKGEKMSLRKGLTLLLLSAFGFSTIAPALAATTVSVNGGVAAYIAQDAGVKTSGANPDTNVVNIAFTVGLGELDLASVTNLANGATVAYDNDTTDDNAGQLTISVGGGTAANSSAYFLPPTGCNFVALPGYGNPATAVAIADATGDDVSTNIAVTSPGNLPGLDADASYIFIAQVLRDEARGSLSAPAGALAIHGMTSQATTANDGGPVTLTVSNIGLACDASNSPATSGNLEMTYVKPNINSVKSLFVDLANGAKFPIATYTSRVGKLEALVAGDTVGKTAGVAEDSQINTLISNTALSTVTTVNFGPGQVTGVVNTTTAGLDIDAILIRAAEVPGATTSTQVFQTPFATAKFVTAKNLDSDANELRDADLANSTLFDNESNALITVDIEITSFSGGASSATLNVTNAFVGVETETATTATASIPGFLGAVAYPVLDTSGATTVVGTDAALISVDPARSTGDHVVDGRPIEETAILDDENGFLEGAALIPDQTYVSASQVLDAGDFTTDATSNATTLIFGDATLVDPDRAFLFPGVFLDNELNDVNDVAVKITNTTAKSATSVTFTVDEADLAGDGDAQIAASGEAYRNSRTVFTNLLPAASTHGAQYHLVFGSNTATENNTAKNQVVLGITDLSENEYSTAAAIEPNSEETYTDNVILASKLTSAGTGKKFTVQILPFVNKYDAQRDVISVRPKGTITLNTAALTEGVKLIAKVSGNNLSGTKTLTLANVVPAGAFTSALTSRVLPVSGDDKLMVHTTGNVATGRDTITVSSVDGASTATDSIDDIVGSGKVLDTNVPPLFGGGVAGNTLTSTAARGPIPFIQPKGRVLAIEEVANGDFKAINDLGTNARIRITLPAGTDLNLYGNNGTAHQNFDDVLAIFGTGGFSTAISVANNITHVQKVTSTTTQAFIDIDLPTTSNPIVAIKRGLYLVFRPDALVVPKGVTNLNATVSIVDVGTTVTAITDDTTLSTVGTVALAPALSNFLSVAFSPRANSAYRSTSSITPANEAFVRPLVETKYGSQPTSFSTPISKVVRFVNNDGTPDQNNLWDIVVSEGVADAFPIGGNADGFPTTYINGTVTKTEVLLHCLLSNPAIVDDVAAQTATILVSDSSIVPGTLAKETGTDNGFVLPLTAGTLSGAPRAADTLSTVTVSGIKLETTGNLAELTDTDIACWTEVDATAGAAADADAIAVIGSPVGRSIGGNAATIATATELFPLPTNVDAVADLLATQRLAGSTAVADDTAFDTNVTATDKIALARSVFNTTYQDTAALIDNGIGFIVDDASNSAKLLDNSTKVTVTIADLPTVNGTAVAGGDKQVTLTAAAGTLQAGTLITVTTTSPASPVAETVTVPVLDNGSFRAVLRSAPTATLTLTQTPATSKTGANIQVKVIDLNDVTSTPEFNDVVPTLLTSTIAAKGSVIALFNTPAVTGFTFADVEATAKVNGVAVTKVATGKYAAIVPATASTFTLTVTVDGEPVTTTLTLATVTATGKAVPAIGTVNVKADDNVVVNVNKAGATFPSDLSFEIVYTDGTTAVVANSAVALKKAGARAKFANPEAAKTIAFVQAVAAGGSRAKSL